MSNQPEEDTQVEVYYKYITIDSFLKAYLLGFMFIRSGVKLALFGRANVPAFRAPVEEKETPDD